MTKLFGIAIVATALILGSVGMFFGLPAPAANAGISIHYPQESAGIIVIMYPTFYPSVKPMGYPSVRPVGYIMR